jgi:hypothetical protein
MVKSPEESQSISVISMSMLVTAGHCWSLLVTVRIQSCCKRLRGYVDRHQEEEKDDNIALSSW